MGVKPAYVPASLLYGYLKRLRYYNVDVTAAPAWYPVSDCKLFDVEACLVGGQIKDIC